MGGWKRVQMLKAKPWQPSVIFAEILTTHKKPNEIFFPPTIA